MSRFIFTFALLALLMASHLGCGAIQSTTQLFERRGEELSREEDSKTYSIGDMPADNHRPRSLDSLTNRANANASAFPNTGAPATTAAPSGRLGPDQVQLNDSSVHVETEMPDSPPTDQEQRQLPEIFENTANLSASDSRPNSNDQSALAATAPPPRPPAEESPDEVIAPVIDSTEFSRRNDTPSPNQDGQPSKPMKFVATPAEDPINTLPPALDELFVQGKSSDPQNDQPDQANHQPERVNEQPQKNQVNETSVARGRAGRTGKIIYLSTPESKNDVNPKLESASYQQPVEGPKVQPIPDEPPQSANVGQPVAAGSSTEPIARNQPKQLTWKNHLEQTIHLLSNELSSAAADETAERQITLHLLKIIEGKIDAQVAEPDFAISGRTAQESAFWKHQLQALDQLMNENGVDESVAEITRRARLATNAVEHLQQAKDELSNLAALRINRPVFCTQVAGFGKFTPAHADFVSGQQVLIYCEVENYALQSSGKTAAVDGHAPDTRPLLAELRGEYSIIDSDNRVVNQHQYQPVKDSVTRRRQDFYMYFPVSLPQLIPGQYRLQLFVEDLIGNKVASTRQPLAFRIVPRPTPFTRGAKTARQVGPATGPNNPR